MSPQVKKHTSNTGSANKWITVSLVLLLVASLAFVGWAFYSSRQTGVPVETSAEEAPSPQPPPTPPPPPQYSCPLDGTLYSDHTSTTNRPIVVQIDNAPAARPQSGLSQADIVYEAMAEGQITRFSAIYACREVNNLGPVRSARLIDLELVPEYQALLADSGSSEGVTAAIESSADIPNITPTNYADAFWRTFDRLAPHNLMTSTTEIRKAAAAAGYDVQTNITGPAFKPETPGAAAINTISIPYSQWANVSYTYDQRTNSWLRFIGGEPHIDALTGTQIAAKNVIIQYVQVTQSDIVEDANGDVGLIFNLTGSGKAVIFRDGQIFSGRWLRESKNAVTSYIDAAGKVIPLDVGQTWIQLVPADFQASWE